MSKQNKANNNAQHSMKSEKDKEKISTPSKPTTNNSSTAGPATVAADNKSNVTMKEKENTKTNHSRTKSPTRKEEEKKDNNKKTESTQHRSSGIDKQNGKPNTTTSTNNTTNTNNANTNANKSKKKKVKKLFEASKYQTYFTDFPVVLKSSQGRGRHAVASKNLSPGTLVSDELPVTSTVKKIYLEEICQVCLTPFQLIKTKKLSCDECKLVYYCHEDCQKADKAKHDLECSILPKLDKIATDCQVDIDLLKLILGLLSNKLSAAVHSKEFSKNDEHHANKATFDIVMDLISHRGEMDKPWLASISSAAKALVAILPEKLSTSESEIIDHACRLNNNLHGLGDVLGRNTDVAVGLFPLGSLFFNHSCAPNAHFIANQGRLQFRTLIPIREGEEITVSYIDLYAARNERREELFKTKHFKCECIRCRGSNGWAMKDRVLDGVMCQKCKNGVYLTDEIKAKIQANTSHPTAAISMGKTNANANHNNNINNNKKNKKSNQNEKGQSTAEKNHTTTSTEETPVPAAAAETKIHEASQLFCEHCNYEISLNEVQTIRTTSAEILKSIVRTLTELKDAAKAKSQTQEFLQTYGKQKVLHPLHADLLNARIPLLNATHMLGDLNGSALACKEIVEAMTSSQIYPPIHHELADFLCHLGELFGKCAIEKKKENNTILERRFAKDSKDAYKRCLEMRKIVFGENHVKTLDVKKRLLGEK